MQLSTGYDLDNELTSSEGTTYAVAVTSSLHLLSTINMLDCFQFGGR
jgi:hypothetical protein